jgi:dCMP deaminase
MASNDHRLQAWDALFMRFASDVANMSYAKRLKVGAVAVRDKRVIAIGYNGTPSGEDKCCEEVINGALVTKSNVVHAEANLIKYAKTHNIDLVGCTLYITHSPCQNCGHLVMDAQFVEVIYGKPYRDTTILLEIEAIGIKVNEWN